MNATPDHPAPAAPATHPPGRRVLPVVALVALGGAAVLVLDQLTKWWVVSRQEELPLQVVPGCFRVVYVENTGVAFGLLSGLGGALLLPSVLGCLVVLYLLYMELRQRSRTPLLVPSLGLILGGALGNLVDRVRLGYVIDFIDWYYGTCHWYTFNVADSAITCGVVLLILGSFLAGETQTEETNPIPAVEAKEERKRDPGPEAREKN